MGITQTMYLGKVKNLDIWGRKKKFVNFEFRFNTEIKKNETEKLWTWTWCQKKKCAVKKLINEGYWTSYEFALIKIYVEEESWGLDKLWIWCL